MQQPQQEIHVYGYSAGVVPTSDAPPKPQPQPPPRRRLSPFRILVIAFIAFCTLVGVLALLIWLIYRPWTIQVAVAVDSATLSRFIINSTTIPKAHSFNLTADLIISNPNKRVAVYYDLLQAEGYYQDERFGRVALPVSFQGARRADAVRAVLEGSSAVGLGVDALGDDNGTGVYPVDLWIDGLVRYKFGELVTTSASTLSVKCPLVLQLMVASTRVECTVNL